ncbi:MAG: hypothetical protein E2591_16710 [Achromobacter sp.]|uniref:MmgE/PrpD family protein n=1 Tax=Achromobacter sp. TaxID=134375 RepID=UPI0012C6B6E8|nr:MmgE/PrpD family protein [Achromobacter sp.]MPS79708.1 hypothetical protein [Achromobacter sp.]
MSGLNENSGSSSLEWRLAKFCAGLKFDDVPADVVVRSELLLADVVSCMLLSAGDEQFRLLAKKLSVDSSGGASTITVGAAYPEIATQINAIAAHWYEWDDVYDEGALHITAVVIPVLMAAVTRARQHGSLVRDFMASFVAAIEISCRIGKVLLPGLKTGWMPTGIACAIGAAAGAVKLQGGTLQEISDAMGLAAVACGAGRQPLADMVNGKSVLCSQVALNAYGASRLALAGVHGGMRYLVGPFGVSALFLDRDIDLLPIIENLGRTFELSAVKLKRYPCCRATHKAIDTVLGLRAELARQGLRCDDIESIRGVTVTVPPQAYELCGSPYSDSLDARVGRQFSIAYLVAAALVQGEITPELYANSGAQQERRISELAQRTEVFRSVNAHQTSSQSRGVELCLFYADGAVLEWDSNCLAVDPIDDYDLVKKKLSFVDRGILERVQSRGLFLRSEVLKIDVDMFLRQFGSIV